MNYQKLLPILTMHDLSDNRRRRPSGVHRLFVRNRESVRPVGIHQRSEVVQRLPFDTGPNDGEIT
jgi:hypothetical protein